MSTDTNATWFDGAAFEYVQTGAKRQKPIRSATPIQDAMPRTSVGVVNGWWFNEETGKPVWVWGA